MSGPLVITDWKDLCSFRPPLVIQGALLNRFDPVYFALRLTDPDADPLTGYFHAIEDAVGDINLDRYMVWVDDLPENPGGGGKFSAEEFLTYWRTHINDFVDTSISAFFPYAPRRDPTGNVDEVKWNSSSPLGAVITIELPILGPDESGSVVCTLIEPNRWRFSTWKTPGDNNHPVSGNREFGFYRGRYKGRRGFVFQTRGADRITAFGSLLPDDVFNVVFGGADSLWRSLQQGLATFINSHGGTAEVISPAYSSRYGWTLLKPFIFSPTTPRLHIPQTEFSPF